MAVDENDAVSGEEIKKEFQVERMILFSDAVFAIVITLMAIDIKIPEQSGEWEWSPQILSELAPTFFAYCISFLFIGTIWYQHLTLFSIVKEYDKGLVIRNLLLLFFITLFPFTAAAMTGAAGGMIPFFMYMGIILLSMATQFLLYHYIIFGNPALRVQSNIGPQLEDLKKKRISLIMLTIFFVVISVTYAIIRDPEQKSLSILWMLIFPFMRKILVRKNNH